MRQKLKIANRFAGFTPLEILRLLRIRAEKRRFLTGFTLTEVVVASTLLVIAIVPILKALTTAHVNTTIIERRTQSLFLARAKLDKIKARSIYNYTNSGASFAENNIVLDGSYLCNVTDNSGDPLKQITVLVGYDLSDDGNLSDDEIEVTLSTLIARRW